MSVLKLTKKYGQSLFIKMYAVSLYNVRAGILLFHGMNFMR